MNREVKKMKDVVKIHQVGTCGTLSGIFLWWWRMGGGVHAEHLVYVFYGGGGWGGGGNCEGGAST
jgi:hypothetical protein